MNIRPFEIALIAVSAIIAIAGLIVLSNYQSKPSAEEALYGDRVVIWGTLSQPVVSNFLTELGQDVKAAQVISYRQIDERTFEDTVVNAIADGKSPDLLMIPHTLLVSLRTKLTAIPFETLPERTFRESYIDGADIFLRSNGVYGIPFAVDPLMMYWNRDIFAGAGIAQPPTTWEGLMAQTVGSITRLNDARGIIQSTVAFGEYTNVAHAKEILSMLFLQTGTDIVRERDTGYTVTLDDDVGNGLVPGEAALNFYSQFALPNKDLYSWNRSQTLDRNAFTGGTLALYFGLGSEWREIDRENPNLNYDITRVPQGVGATTPRTYGEFYAFVIPRASQKASGAYAVAQLLSSPVQADKIVNLLDLAPVHRSLYATESTNAFRTALQRSGIITRGWLDPSPARSSAVFKSMIEEATAGDTRTKSIIFDVARSLEALF